MVARRTSPAVRQPGGVGGSLPGVTRDRDMLRGFPGTFTRAPLRRGLHQRAVDEIGSRIVVGEFRAGDVLIEAELGERFGISRSGIREAIKVLAAKGLVESRTKVGTTIRPRDCWNMLDPDLLWWWSRSDDTEGFTRAVLEVRLLIEPGAAALAAERAGDEAVGRIADAYRAMLAHDDDPEKAVRADGAFHVAVLELTGNELLRSLASLIETALMASFKVTSAMPNALTRALPMQKAVLDAIASHDSVEARRAMDALLADARDHLLDAYRLRAGRRGKGDPSGRRGLVA
jgi:DNA-binding FadR family transcriptional regulator